METQANLSSAAPAPPPDSAAAPSGGTAADSSAAAPPPSESAASSETGAQADAPRTLDSLFEEFRTKSAQGEQAAAPEPEPIQEEQPQQAEEPKPEEVEEEPAPAADDDPLAEFEQAIPTREQINKDFARAPKAIRDQFADAAEKLSAREAERAELGGDEGVTVGKVILPHLLSGDTSEQAVNGFMNAVTETNLPLAREIGQRFVNLALDDETTGHAFADSLLVGQFGEGYDLARIQRLVEIDSKGLIDHDAVEQDLGFARTPTERERQLEEQLKAAQSRVKEFEGNRDETARREEQRLSDAIDDFVGEQAMEEVLPIVTKLGWVAREGEEATEALKLHGSMVTAWLNAEIKNSPEYTRISALKEEGKAFLNGKPTTQMRAATNALRVKAKAAMLKAGRTLSPTYAKSFTSTARTAQPPTVKSGDPAAPAPPPAPARAATEQPKSGQETLDELYDRYSAKARDAQTVVGRR